MTLLYVTPVGAADHPGRQPDVFALKIAGLIVVTNLVGVAFFVSGRRWVHAERVTVGQSW